MSPISKAGGGKNCYMCCWSRYVTCVNFCNVMNGAGSCPSVHFPGFFCQVSRKNGINIGAKFSFSSLQMTTIGLLCFFFYTIQIPNHSGEHFAGAFGII